MKLLNGTIVAQKIYDDIRKKVAKMKIKPVLAVILVGDDPASRLYVSIKEKRCSEVEIEFKKYALPADTKQKMIEDLIKKLNLDKKVTGFIIQLPLPKHFDTNKIINKIDPSKDVDGLHPINLGKLLIGEPAIAPPTAAGILELLKYYKISLDGKNVAMIGYGKLVGKPLANMITISHSNATLTICNKSTKNLKAHTKRADILISATGQGHLIKSDMIKKDAIVIDAGTSTIGGKIVGDVDFESVSKIASYITPPKGGVGPMTVAMLLKNLIKLSEIIEKYPNLSSRGG